MRIAHILQQIFQLNDAPFVAGLYRELFNREPDPEGLQHHVNLLRQGIPKNAIVAGLVQSGEARGLYEKPVIAMSTLGTNGRFGNQIFQYAFLKIYAVKYNFRVETSSWIGQHLFGHQDPPVARKLPMVIQRTYKLHEDHIPNAQIPYQNVDFAGYFQYHTSYYAPYKDYFCSLFQPVPEIKARMEAAAQQLRARGRTVIGLHLRRGDYGTYHQPGLDYFYVAPSDWYLEWLKMNWSALDSPVLFIASDEPDKVLRDFRKYAPVTSADLGAVLPEADFYPDFYLLSQCDVLAISNSSFSFAASMLNRRGRLFLRPHLEASALLPYDPWNSEPILRSKDAVL